MDSKPYKYYFKLDDGVEGKAVGMTKNPSTKTVQFEDVKIVENDKIRDHFYYVVPEEKIVALEEIKPESKKPKKRAKKAK